MSTTWLAKSSINRLAELPPYTLLNCDHVLGTETLPVLKAAMRDSAGWQTIGR
jgi:hypothetical protein